MEETRRHPITNALFKAPFSHTITVLLIGLATYLGFLIIAILTGEFAAILFTVMHLIQIDFSMTIIVGLYFLNVFYRTFEKKFGEMRSSFIMDDESFELYLDDVFKKMNSPRGYFIGLPIVLLSIASVFFFLAPTMPNPLFPVDPFSILWIYFSVFEFSIFMLILFGVGIWLGIAANSVATKIGKTIEVSLKPISPDRAGGLVSFSEALLKGVFMYSALIAMVFPLLIFIIGYLRQFNPLLAYIPVIGLSIAILSIFLFFLIPQYSIHKVMVDEKERLLQQVSEEVNSIIGDIHDALGISPTGRDTPSQQLMLLSLQLTELFNQIEQMRTWPSDLTVFMKAISALLAIILTFVLNEILVMFLEGLLG
jgi:hypothetical protein